MDSATWATLITSLAVLVKMFWEGHQAEKRAIREREWQIADRMQVAAVVAVRAEQVSTEIQEAIAENTALTGVVGQKADAASKAAKAAHEKIASLLGDVKP